MDKIFSKIRRSLFFNRILIVLGFIGLDKVALKIMYGWYEKHPTQSMIKTQKYFLERESDIGRISEYLSDERSRFVWNNMIQFRKTMNYKYHPGKDKKQYFAEDIIKLGNKEFFLDCGAFDGNTTLDFIAECKSGGGDYGRIVIFEPDKNCFEMINDNIPQDNRIFFIPKGVWNESTNLNFEATGDMVSHVVESDQKEMAGGRGDTVQVVAIDECCECENASFIKMDLEGAEQKALKGAKNTIVKNKPKLAISIYHSDEDMIEIIDFIHTLVPEYRLYVRQYSTGWVDTVLYAVI